MNEDEAKEILRKDLNFRDIDIQKLEIFRKSLLEYNANYNLISKKTEEHIWSRHILDSAQLINHFESDISSTMADLGSGAGFPGLILSIFIKNPEFHVKLYEKSPVKRDFLNKVINEIKLNVEIHDNVYNGIITADIIVCRAFKKLEHIIKISREIVRKPHQIIILKGKNAQSEINNVSLASNYSYKLENSITDADSKIILIKVR
jgi:16S rRNA (guanine527-N7)-methyltransferase